MNLEDKNRVIIVSLVTAICLLGDSMLYIALPIYWNQVGLQSLWEVGIILSINRFVRLPLNPLIGWLYTKITLRTGLITAVILTTLTTIGYGIGEGLWIWIILRCVWGLAWSFLRLGGFFTVLTYANDSNRGYLFGTYNGLYRLGSLFGMLLGGVLSSIIGLKMLAIIFGITTVISLPLIILFIQQRTAVSAPPQKSTRFIDLDWRSSAIRNVIISGFLMALLFQGVLTSTLSFVVSYHYTELILLLGITVTAAALSGYLQGFRWICEPFLAARFGRWSDGPQGRRPIFISSLIMAAVGFACIPLAMPIHLWLIIVLMVMITATSLTTLMDTLASDAAKTSNAISFMTLYSVVLDFGAASGPLLAFFILTFHNGVHYIYLGGAVIFLFICGLWVKQYK